MIKFDKRFEFITFRACCALLGWVYSKVWNFICYYYYVYMFNIILLFADLI